MASRKTGHQLRFIGAGAINAGTPRDAVFYPAVQANNLGDEDTRPEQQSLVRAKQQAPMMESITDTLAWVQYRRGQYAAALPLLEE